MISVGFIMLRIHHFQTALKKKHRFYKPICFNLVFVEELVPRLHSFDQNTVKQLYCEILLQIKITFFYFEIMEF